MDIVLGDLKHEIGGVQRQGQVCCIEQEINGSGYQSSTVGTYWQEH
jgi:hypothetical protein